MNSIVQEKGYSPKQSSIEPLYLLEIIPGTIYYEQFANNESGGNNDEQIDSQVKFRPSTETGWMQDIGVPNPMSIDWDGEVITNVEQNAKGDVFLEFVGKKRKLSVKWGFLTQVEYNCLLNHLKVDFRVSHQNYLYYKITTFNPNGPTNDNNESDNKDTDDEQVQNNKPQLDSFITYMDSKHGGQVRIYNQGDEVLIGYSDISLTFIER